MRRAAVDEVCLLGAAGGGVSLAGDAANFSFSIAIRDGNRTPYLCNINSDKASLHLPQHVFLW